MPLPDPEMRCFGHCPPGTHITYECACKPCEPGSFNSVKTVRTICDRCKSHCFGRGEVTVKPCTKFYDLQCGCPRGHFHYQPSTHVSKCISYNECDVGMGVSKPGSNITDVFCVQCVDGKNFSDVKDHSSQCQTCTRCDLGVQELQSCLHTRNAQCNIADIENTTRAQNSSNVTAHVSPNQGAIIGSIIGSISGVILLVIIAVIAFIVWRRRQYKERQNDYSNRFPMRMSHLLSAENGGADSDSELRETNPLVQEAANTTEANHNNEPNDSLADMINVDVHEPPATSNLSPVVPIQGTTAETIQHTDDRRILPTSENQTCQMQSIADNQSRLHAVMCNHVNEGLNDAEFNTLKDLLRGEHGIPNIRALQDVTTVRLLVDLLTGRKKIVPGAPNGYQILIDALQTIHKQKLSGEVEEYQRRIAEFGSGTSSQ